MKTVLFAYNFPHKKTQDFLNRLLLINQLPDLIIAADPVALSFPKQTIRISARHADLVHPRELAERFDIPYVVAAHNDAGTVDILREHDIERGIISGARILKEHIVDAVPGGIINFHPALLPEARGLDTVKWCIYHGIPLGVTAHFIDPRIDAGQLIQRMPMQVYADDTYIDLSLRITELQTQMIPDVLAAVEGKMPSDFPAIDVDKGMYNPPIDEDVEVFVQERFPDYLVKFKTN